MSVNMLMRTSLTRISLKPLTSLSGRFKRYHSEVPPSPVVPLALHDPNFFLVPEDSSPIKFFQPEIPEINLDTLKKYSLEAVEKLMKLKTQVLQRTTELDLILISNQAIQTAKEMPSRFNSFLISYDGAISVEKIVPIAKIKSNVSDAGGKLKELTDKLPISSMQEKWDLVKQKMPSWQNTIATKLQDLQDTINKRFNPKKPDGA